MKICITVGHSILKDGRCTSADGRRYGGVLEYKWSKSFSKKLEDALLRDGHEVTRIVCPERTLETSGSEKNYKLERINSGTFDLLIELHLNAFDDPGANGTTVLYKTDAGKKYADAIQKKLATVFRNRGVTQRNDLYILNQTKPPAILIETFFCTCYADCKKAKGKKNKKKLAGLVADGIREAGR